MMTMIETAGADVRAAAATSDTDHAVLLMIGIAGDLIALETLGGCMEEEEAGAVRVTDTGRGPGESLEGDRAHDPNPHLHERVSTQRRPPTTLKKKCDVHTPHPAPGPGPHQDHALVRVLGPDPGLGASQEDARRVPAPRSYPSLCQMHQSWFIC